VKPNTVILVIVGIFILAAGVVVYVLHRTDKTLENAQKAADKAKGLVSEASDFGTLLKKTWTDAKGLFTETHTA
jgi:flagellar basal body-associated protein FliL